MTYLEFLATIIIGYILGRLHQEPELKGILGARIKELKDQYNRHNTKVGPIQTPSQSDIIRKENPQLAEEEDSMRDLFQGLGVKHETD